MSTTAAKKPVEKRGGKGPADMKPKPEEPKKKEEPKKEEPKKEEAKKPEPAKAGAGGKKDAPPAGRGKPGSKK